MIRKLRIHILLLLLTGSPLLLHAQSSTPIWLGARIGADLGTFAYSPKQAPDPQLGWKVGMAIGAELDYWFSENIGVAFEPSFVQKGAYQKLTEVNGQPLALTYESSAIFSYIQLPILLKVTYGELPFKPYLFAGPSVGFKASTSSTTTVGNETTSSDLADSEVTAINFSIIGGVGVTYSIGSSMQLFIESVYDLGLSNLNPDAGQSTQFSSAEQNPHVYTRDIRASVGILFKL